MIEISQQAARNLAITQQGLSNKKVGKGLQSTYNAIEQLGYLQIDTISVVARAHHQTMWARLPHYQTSHLAQLQENQEDRQIFEYWSHAAAYLPISDYRFCLPRMHAYRTTQKHWHNCDPKIKTYVYDRIKAEGPLMSKDFKPPPNHKSGTWWNWKPSKIALEHLFMEGNLMIKNRQGFQKIYDLPERVLPPHINTTIPSTIDYATYLINSNLKAHGLASLKTIAHLKKKELKTIIQKVLLNLVELGVISPLKIANNKETFYIKNSVLTSISSIKKPAPSIQLLCPFDNAIIHRARVKNLFNFSYKLECYVPKLKRIYGYYNFAILYGNQFIGMLDPKADRKNKQLILQNIHLAENIKLTESLLNSLSKKIINFAAFNGCEAITIVTTFPKKLKTILGKTIIQNSPNNIL